MGGQFIGGDHAHWLDTFWDALPYLLVGGSLLAWVKFLLRFL